MFKTIGDWLAAHGCTMSIWWGSAPHVLRMTPWNNAAPWDGVQRRLSYSQRYGYINEGLKGDGDDPSQRGIDHSLLSAGTTVGELGGGAATMILKLQTAARHPSNPFNLLDNTHYIATTQDAQDALVVMDPQTRNSVYNSLIAHVFAATVDAPLPIGTITQPLAQGGASVLPPTPNVISSAPIVLPAPPPVAPVPAATVQVHVNRSALIQLLLALGSILLQNHGSKDSRQAAELLKPIAESLPSILS